MELVHNDLYMLKECSYDMPEGVYRVIAVLPQQDLFFAYFLPNFEDGGVKYSGSSNLFFTQLENVKNLIDYGAVIFIESEMRLNFTNRYLSE